MAEQSLMNHLVEKFEEQGGEGSTSELQLFIAFANRYLNENRPVETFYAFDNIGIKLTNQERILISPAKEEPPHVMGKGAVPITPGNTE